MLKFNKGDDAMGRPIGTKNIMRTPEEKEKLVLEYLDSKVGYRKFAESNDIYPSTFAKWIKLYRERGIEGLKSKNGKNGTGKGYVVKGVGAKKEYASISDVNIK